MDYWFSIAANVENMTDAFNILQTLEEMNTALDASLGYKNNYQIVASMNEVKLFNISEEDDADLRYGNQ